MSHQEYFERKEQALRSLSPDLAVFKRLIETIARGKPVPSDLFHGVVAYFDGAHTTVHLKEPIPGFPAGDLQLSTFHWSKILQVLGGRGRVHLTSDCTHVFCPNLSGSKMDSLVRMKGAMRTRYVLRCQWLISCIEAGTRLSEGPFLIGSKSPFVAETVTPPVSDFFMLDEEEDSAAAAAAAAAVSSSSAAAAAHEDEAAVAEEAAEEEDDVSILGDCDPSSSSSSSSSRKIVPVHHQASLFSFFKRPAAPPPRKPASSSSSSSSSLSSSSSSSSSLPVRATKARFFSS